jgi:hypothetical protein
MANCARLPIGNDAELIAVCSVSAEQCVMNSRRLVCWERSIVRGDRG